MNIFVIYFIICSFSIVLSSCYGRKIDVNNSIDRHNFPGYSDSTKSKFKGTSDVSKELAIDDFSQKKHLFKINVNAPQKSKKSHLAFTGVNAAYPELDSLDKHKNLAMTVGNHLVKVKSALETKKFESKAKGGGYEISINPKYSHVIDIIHGDGFNRNKEHRFTEEGISEESERRNFITVTSDATLDPEEFKTGDNSKFSDKFKTLVMKVDKYFVKVKSELESKKLESAPEGGGYIIYLNPIFSHTVEIIPVESIDSEKEHKSQESAKSQEVITTDDILSSEEFVKTDNTLSPKVPNVEQANKNDGKESSFSTDIEGSGEEFLSSEDFQNGQVSFKEGRILKFFPRRNETSQSCTTPKGETGQCRRIRQCLLSDALNNFNVFFQHMCLIRGVLVGICCPENPVIEISNHEENATQITPEEIKQPPEGCGLNTKTRIVGGSISGPHEWTWMVALLRRNRFYCGGVIINNWYVLTAAHCVLGIDVKDITVRLGEYDFNTHSKHREDISVSEIKRHAQFVTITFQHDIALLKLKRRIQYSKFVGSICLPTQKARDYTDVNGTVVGWGTVSFGGSASSILRQVTVPVWKNKECDKTYFLENIDDSFLCAGSPEKGEDACQGDSGGPLMTLNERGRWEVIGLVSWGRRCGDPTYPGVYTRVTTYLDWINQNAK